MAQRTRLMLALGLTALVAVVEFWGGFRAQSLALLSDAAHVCMDLFALGIALAAMLAAQRPATPRQTFGFGRLEMLAALTNGALLFGATIVIVSEAIRRLGAPLTAHGALMSEVALFGLVVNGSVGLILLRDGRRNLNVAAALFHVAGDALGAAAVIAGGLLILRYRVAWLDPALSLFVAAIIVVGVLRILREASHVLLGGVPQSVRTDDVLQRIRAFPGVVAVHDLHIWTLGAQSYALAAHVQLDDRRISEATSVLRALETMLRDRFAIGHVTIQFECEACEPDERVICTQLNREASDVVPSR
ncbi:MAG: cation transporter [Candidatus Eremiobacteraeota bacterium]|nr:cation transporter [Candidatus Eremiobacteraeota bacterium]